MFIRLPIASLRAVAVRPAVLCALMASPLAKAQDKPDFAAEIAPALKAQCYECHNNEKAKSDVNLELLVDEAAYLRSPDLLDAMIWVVEEHEMPPADYDPKPTDAERARFVEWAQTLLAEAQNAAPNEPGRVVMPRLNHLEYNQVIEDITGHPIDVADIFPRDGGGGEGFANVGEAQTATPMQVEKFLVAAKEVVDHATILAGGLISWNAEPQVDANNPLDRLESLKEQWAEMHADMYHRLLNELQTEVESGFEHRFTPYLEAAWRYHHRAGLGMPNASFADIAKSMELNIPPLILQKWYTLMSQPQNSRYLDIIIRRFHAIDGPESLDDAAIRTEASRMAEYLELYGRQIKGDAKRPIFELEPEWTRVTDKDKRQRARRAYERDLDEGKYTFHIDLSKIEEPPQYLYLITSPAGDGNEDDIVVWSDGTFDNGQKQVSWRWHDGVQLTSANGQPLTWGDHPNYIGIERTSVGVKAPAVFRTAVPPGAKSFSVQARIDAQYGREGSVQVLIDTSPPPRMEELAGRFVLGIRDSERRRDLLQATRDVRRAVFDHNIQKMPTTYFMDSPISTPSASPIRGEIRPRRTPTVPSI